MIRMTDRARPFSFRRLGINIGILLIIPLIIGGVAYRSAFVALEEGAKKLHEAVIARATDLWSSEVQDIRASIGALATNRSVREFALLEDPYEGARIYQVREAVRQLGSLLVAEDLLREVYIVYPSNGVIVSRTTAYRLERFYPAHLSYPGIESDDWSALLRSSAAPYSVLPSSPVRDFGGAPEEVVTLIAPIANLPVEAYIVILLRTSGIVDLFSGIDLSAGGWAALRDASGAPVTIVGDREACCPGIVVPGFEGLSQSVVSGSTLLTVAGADGGAWQFVASVPISSITRSLRAIWQVTGLVLAIILGVGMAILGIVGIRLMRPVRLLSQDNERLQEEVAAQQPLIVASFLERLFRGDFASQSEIEAHQALTELDLAGSWLAIVSCHITSGASEPATVGDATRRSLVIIAEAIARTTREIPVHQHSMTTDTLTLLVVGRSADTELSRSKIEQIVGRAMEFVPDTIGGLCSWGVGMPRRRLIDVSDSFREATIALDYQEIRHEHTLVFYDDIPRREPGYAFPAETENRVTSLTRSGQTEELVELLMELYRENIDSRHPDALAPRLFAKDLLCTVMKIVELHLIRDSQRAEAILTALDAAEGEVPYRQAEIAIDLLREISEICDAQKKSHNDDLSSRLVAYVEKHFVDSTLSRGSVAEAFSLSEAYVSQFFREQVGETLGSFIQEKRLREARKLLVDGDVPVKEIGVKVGYASYPTFARAFKKAFGVSATDFRDQAKNLTI